MRAATLTRNFSENLYVTGWILTRSRYFRENYVYCQHIRQRKIVWIIMANTKKILLIVTIKVWHLVIRMGNISRMTLNLEYNNPLTPSIEYWNTVKPLKVTTSISWPILYGDQLGQTRANFLLVNGTSVLVDHFGRSVGRST